MTLQYSRHNINSKVNEIEFTCNVRDFSYVYHEIINNHPSFNMKSFILSKDIKGNDVYYIKIYKKDK